MTIESETFSECVKKVCSQFKLSQENLAYTFGVSFTKVNHGENGDGNGKS